MNLETIVGDLRVYKKIVPGTFQHADELMDGRRDNPKLPKEWFYTADGQGYFLRDDGEIDWVITREPENLVLRHLYDRDNNSFEQLVHQHNFRPANKEALEAKDAPNTVKVDYDQLILSEYNHEWCYLDILFKNGYIKNPLGYIPPFPEEQKVITRLGYTSQNIQMLKDRGITTTRIYVLAPDYI